MKAFSSSVLCTRLTKIERANAGEEEESWQLLGLSFSLGTCCQTKFVITWFAGGNCPENLDFHRGHPNHARRSRSQAGELEIPLNFWSSYIIRC